MLSVMSDIHVTYRLEAVERGLPQDGVLLVVTVSDQRLHVITGDGLERNHLISTSRFGTGHVKDSRKTPTGYHRVSECIGADAPLGQVFKAREPTGLVLPPERWRGADADDYITTRILRLDGLEPGINLGGHVDTLARFIYIHGTNHEDRLGEPASNGCIRMANQEIVELFNRIRDRIAWCRII